MVQHRAGPQRSFQSGYSDVVVAEGQGGLSFRSAPRSDGSWPGSGRAILDPSGQSNVRRNSWLQTSALVAAAILGTGVLALPVNFSKLGLVMGSVALVACYPLNFFTGYLLNRLHLTFPSVVTMGDLGQRVMGPTGAILGYVGLYVLLFFHPGELHGGFGQERAADLL